VGVKVDALENGTAMRPAATNGTGISTTTAGLVLPTVYLAARAPACTAEHQPSACP